ncbi:negative regulation of DNA replication [Desmophyllum pertusum]|uniref:Negative regulation of DNA replication n=1 Tax=Desmophyllum pertusum TaxID=174260 RepID=A0A9X0CIF7_9CNID|nr:negative regulation of DNA replication [Desmophyllum pertusum]
MCEEERSGSRFPSIKYVKQSTKIKSREVSKAPRKICGLHCPLVALALHPVLVMCKSFFKGFIQSAASHSFNQHLTNLLIVKIDEINDKEFPLSDIEEGSEKDLSIQNQELKQDFSCCLKNIRILAKFLGFLLFQPYYGAETTSQVIVADALKIRNRIPIQFDILSYLKKAWCSGRLVLTIPWVVEYLSMMDPLAPLLDYFSGVLHFLHRIYREAARPPSPKQELNHSKLLLLSCLGWFFEIPDLSGLVGQTILYSCCPYLGEIRSVLVEAAAGISGRSGPVKKITPISTGEPARISSSHKQLQLQLEENFFRIQPDFLKRLSDFTVERLCSNIISHIKGGIIPSLLDKGVQRIQEFLNNEFPGNVNTDQAKEKCRPHVLKIIHSVTDDGVKTALETVELV